jgi:hypothetical protein
MIKKNKQIKQTGLLFRLDPQDYKTGASPLVLIDINPSGDWTKYKPNEEKQSREFTFDTMSCTTFSALNCIETWVNYFIDNKKFTTKQIQEMNKLGFMADGKFNASDRFTAIMSNTMRNGNYFQAVLDSIRRDGLLPEALLPFDKNLKKWDEYHNKNIITQDMKDTARKILDIIEVSYEWCSFSPETVSLVYSSLKQCPIQGAIPVPGTHAVQIISKDSYFDTYSPFTKKLGNVHYSMKIIVSVKKPISDNLLVEIKRDKSTSKQTLGILTAQNGKSTFTCKTLELPWLENKSNISCIPIGTYDCRYSFSPKFNKYTFEILKVPKRSGIRFHVGNYYTQIQGCILLGDSVMDINNDGILDVLNSKKTIQSFETFMNNKSFRLTIK